MRTITWRPKMSEPLRKCRSCGLEAYTEQDLELFVKAKDLPYGRETQCKKCHNEHRTKLKPQGNYLKKCNTCGLEAKNIEELDLFVKYKNMLFGRRNMCKKCKNLYNNKKYVKGKFNNLYYRRKRLFLDSLPKPILCYFCREEIVKLDGQESESLHIHSLDGNHDNWDFKNKVAIHGKCHAKLHHLNKPESIETRKKMSLSRQGKGSYNWQGDEASEGAKYCREWRKKHPKYLNKHVQADP